LSIFSNWGSLGSDAGIFGYQALDTHTQIFLSIGAQKCKMPSLKWCSRLVYLRELSNRTSISKKPPYGRSPRLARSSFCPLSHLTTPLPVGASDILPPSVPNMRSLVAIRNAILLISIVILIAWTFSWEPISEALYFDSSNTDQHSVSHAAQVSQQTTRKLGGPIHRGQSSSDSGQPEDVFVEMPAEAGAAGLESASLVEDESEDEIDESSEQELSPENPWGLHPVVPDNQHIVAAPETENRFEVMSTQHQYAL
jgi:hypothetical protein